MAVTTPNPIYSNGTQRTLTGAQDDLLNIQHSDIYALRSATISLSFSMDRLPGDVALVSKDANGETDGDFTLWVKDGALVVTQSGGGETEYLRVPEVLLSPQQSYHVSLSFGDDGLMIWLDGRLVGADPEFKQGIELNTNDIVVGGTRSWRSDQDDDAHSLFQGTIGDVMIFDRQLDSAEQLAVATDSSAGMMMSAQMAAAMASLAPVFGQLHGASDTFLDILADYGVNHHGHVAGGLNMEMGTGGDNRLRGSGEADGLNGGGGDDKVLGRGGSDVLQGGYGNDVVVGGGGRDVLDGGHGEDTLRGGGGDDLLISRADGREGAIYYDPDRDEGDPLNELTDGKLYPDQPIPADDLLIGGKGADIFYFQTLINAKERFIEKHTRADGTINWHGVAGENDNLHDHWVDVLGHDVVKDYSRAEGDRLVIEGHTTQIASITYGDADGNGVMDHSVIELYSDQGNNGGAHNDDRLGTITVYGDLVRMSDIEHTAGPAYGIVRTIDDLDEALAPLDYGAEAGTISAPGSRRLNSDGFSYQGASDRVFGLTGLQQFSAEDRAAYVFDHTDNLALSAGTIAFRFTVDSLSGYQGLISKDASDNGDGGHLSVDLDMTGKLVVRFQDATDSYYLVTRNAVSVGEDYDFSLSFGENGVEVYLNGARVAYDTEIAFDLTQNTEALIVGAAGKNNMPGEVDNIHSYFDGTISDLQIFDEALTAQDLFGDDPRQDYAYFNRNIDAFNFTRGDGGSVVVKKGGNGTELWAETAFASFDNLTVRVADIQLGSRSDDTLNGGDGADVLVGKGGMDRLQGMGNDDLLKGGTGDDSLYGGAGQDTLLGEDDDDRLFGSDGRDVLYGGDGYDTLIGGDGNDRLYGGIGDDDIFGGGGDDGGSAPRDRAYFDGDLADFSFQTMIYFDQYRDEDVTRLIVTDAADGGADGVYEGRDRLVDIDLLVFADQTVAFDDLI
ncbi:LamG-like jellyroll fold domain-containing protein [Tritonibacter horizontis]|uniref:RTX-I toxin determinant A from serotypes 1/9 n=1 Tax=Tritonibacter horizontis TaxID=1768241 RepID=A0A132C315_9RHOB|nr:LamG-like jellyroll fold domain-containing protein [Tritonibacter horizontis]KUP94998.1 RTX-I toxin determinant A from serotypes 1/9 [Tritonibacter horizontis]